MNRPGIEAVHVGPVNRWLLICGGLDDRPIPASVLRGQALQAVNEAQIQIPQVRRPER